MSSLSTNRIVHVRTVEVVHHHVVRLTFSDGCAGEVDLAGRLRGPVFEAIAADEELFREVRVDPASGTIVWPDDIDLAPEVLHADAVRSCPHD
jgi:hypothetical protein